MKNPLLHTLLAAAVVCPNAPAHADDTSAPEPELIIPMITIERECFIWPMNIQPKSALEKIIDQASLAKSEGKYEEARLLYVKALEVAEKSSAIGESKNKLRVLLSCEMAECLFLSNRSKSAEQQYFQSLNASRSVNGPLYLANFAPLVGLGYLYLRSGHYPDALEKFKEALDKTIDKRSPQGIKAREAVGLAYAKLNNLALARETFEAAVKDIESEIAEDEVYEKENVDEEGAEGNRASNYANLAYCDYRDGRLQDAHKNYMKAESHFGRKLKTECPTAITILSSHAALLRRLGREDDAKKLDERIAELKARPTSFVKAVDPLNTTKPGVQAYMESLQKKIKAQWRPPKQMFSNQLVVRFKVTRDGKIKHLVVVGSSGNEAVDAKGLKAVEDAAPFSPLPTSINKQAADVQFSFDYNVMNGRR